MNTIVIIDDHTLIAKALSDIVTQFENFEVSYCCENGQEFQKVIAAKGVPHIVLLDISMPIMDGFETAKWLTENYPEVLIMALSMQNDENSLLKMIQNGAKGYMLKSIEPNELESALIKLVDKGHYFPAWVTQKVYTNISEKKIAVESKAEFTEREIIFLSYCATELSYKEIADEMQCSPRTLEYYRNNLCDKLNVKTRVGLALYAYKNGFIMEN